MEYPAKYIVYEKHTICVRKSKYFAGFDFDFDFDLLSEHPIGTQGHKNTKKETKGRKLF